MTNGQSLISSNFFLLFEGNEADSNMICKILELHFKDSLTPFLRIDALTKKVAYDFGQSKGRNHTLETNKSRIYFLKENGEKLNEFSLLKKLWDCKLDLVENYAGYRIVSDPLEF